MEENEKRKEEDFSWKIRQEWNGDWTYIYDICLVIEINMYATNDEKEWESTRNPFVDGSFLCGKCCNVYFFFTKKKKKKKKCAPPFFLFLYGKTFFV